MKLTALMACRNEDWILGLSLRSVLMWCDSVVILLHACTDGSADIVEQVIRENDRGRVQVIREPAEVWAEMDHRQRMLNWARMYGAMHIAYVDADEVLSGNLLRSPLLGIPELARNEILQLPWVCLARSLDHYYAAGPWYNAWVSTVFQDSPELHWTSETRGGYDFHHREPFGRDLKPYRPIQQSPDPAKHQGGLMHLQFVSERRLRAKQCLYKLTEVIRWPGRDSVDVINRRYDLAVYQSDPAKVATAEVPRSWWLPYADLLKYVDVRPYAEPWQEKVCQELWAKHGREKFQGLDLFDVV